MVESLYLYAVLGAAVAGMVVAFVTWLHNDRTGAKPLTLFVVAASLWAVAEGLSVATTGLDGLRFWTQIELSLSTIIPIAWLATVLAYAGKERWLTRSRLALLLVEPGLFAFLVWTNASHGLVWTGGERAFFGMFSTFAVEFKPAFWAHQAYSYLLVAAGGLVLVAMLFRTAERYRTQSTALLGAITLPMVGNALYAFRLVPAATDPTALCYVVSGVVLAGVVFRMDLFRLAPAIREVGREAVLSDLDDSVFIVDDDGHIVDANPAATALLDGDGSEVIGRRIAAELPALSDALADGTDQATTKLDLGGSVRYYDVRISRLYRHGGVVSGRLISLRDVTKQYQRQQRLDVLNRVLRHNIRNELNVVRGNVALAREETDGDVSGRLSDALATLDGIVDRSEKVGQLSRLFDTETDGCIDLAEHLRSDLPKTCREFPGADVTLSVPERLPVAASPAVTAVFAELVRNAIEHNDREHPTVTVDVDEAASDGRYVVVRVSDDGPGIGEQERRVIDRGRETPLDHGSGIGLWMANWVVERAGGQLSIENEETGGVVSVSLPRATEDGVDDVAADA